MTKWQMNRAGLLNFWYYDEEIFEFAEGKLLLRGTNGSGKSVTMQSFIPVLLDGKKTPDRLDPFGSKARKMSDYLLGEEEISKREERTGYLFIEYKMTGSEQYITTGIGMQARRHKDLKSWYFLLTDNRRIGVDFDLAHRSQTEIVPFSQKELQNRIGVGGVVVDSQKEYAELVNKYIFGFETMEAYEDLVKLLIQLRAPKLSKDFKPTVIYEILESALPPLTDDELRHLSDTIESMDQTQQQLEQLTLEYEANAKVLKKYDAYNQYIMAERASRVLAAEERLQNVSEKQQAKELALQETRLKAEQLTEQQRSVQRELHVAASEVESLKSHKVWKLQEDLNKNKGLHAQTEKTVEKLRNRKSDEERKRIEQLHLLRRWTDELDEKLLQQQEIVKEMQFLAQDASFAAHALNAESLERGTMHFDYWQQEVEQHKEQLRHMEKLVSRQLELTEQDRKLERASSEKTMAIDLQQKELEQAEHWFDEEMHRLKTAIFDWMEQYKSLHYTPEQRQQILHVLDGLYEKTAYHEATTVLIEGLNTFRGDITVKRKENEAEQRQIVQEIEEKQKLLERLRQEEMAEPKRAEGTIAFREQLAERNIPFVPFYAAVEFQPHVTDEQKSRLEAVLMTTGVLDSLISPEIFEVAEDALLQPDAQLLGYTLADFLQPDVEVAGISPALVDEVLRSIPIEQHEGGFSLDERGFYRIGCLTGHAPHQGASKFIGRTSRKRYQQEQIDLLSAELVQLEDRLAQLASRHAEILQMFGQADSWQQHIPSDRTLYEIFEEMTTITTKQNVFKEQLKAIDAEWHEVRQQLRENRQKLHEAKDLLNIAQTKEALHEALKLMDAYLQELNNLRFAIQSQDNLRERLNDGRTRLQELEDLIDDYHSELVDAENKLEDIGAEMASIESQLQLEGADEIHARIAGLQELLAKLRGMDDHIRRELPKMDAQESVLVEKLKELEKEAHFAGLMNEQWRKALQEELDLALVALEDRTPQAIVKELKHALSQDRAKMQEQLSKIISEEMNALAEYHVSSYFKETAMLDGLAQLEDERIEAFTQLRGRRMIEMEYRGQRVSPYYIHQSLKAELEERRHYLDEQDRELYEEIIVNSVGRILRQRISRAGQWVKEMDQIMAQRDNSSGLIFSISWKPRTAESEDELDTKELVLLLQRKSSFLSEEDLKKITRHFRSRIERAKETIGLRNEGHTLHQVLKEVLDYRKWFSFVLSYTRQNESKKELTNNAFYKFSGGEKAMAMYIPLFTAAYSRYKEADAMAPYIISLDEAFAGVDEQNIRDMFEVVEQLGFNFIMNSQVIWGDYDTVSNLAIAELVRPKNADYVTVLNYTWNGKERVLND
ncbi:MAG: TIGR02680 family protein [Lysinibacillus sp.]